MVWTHSKEGGKEGEKSGEVFQPARIAVNLSWANHPWVKSEEVSAPPSTAGMFSHVLAASRAGTDGGWQWEPLCGTAAHQCPHQALPWLISVFSICWASLGRCCAQESKVSQGDGATLALLLGLVLWPSTRDGALVTWEPQRLHQMQPLCSSVGWD